MMALCTWRLEKETTRNKVRYQTSEKLVGSMNLFPAVVTVFNYLDPTSPNIKLISASVSVMADYKSKHIVFNVTAKSASLSSTLHPLGHRCITVLTGHFNLIPCLKDRKQSGWHFLDYEHFILHYEGCPASCTMWIQQQNNESPRNYRKKYVKPDISHSYIEDPSWGVAKLSMFNSFQFI